MKEKIQLIYKPFLLALLGSVLACTFLHWLLIIEMELFVVDEMILNLIVPFVVSGLIVLLLLRRRLKILNLQRKHGSMIDFYCLILWIVITVPLVIAQEYLVTVTGKMTELTSVADINKAPATKYYRMKGFFIHKNAAAVRPTFAVTGKNNANFNMQIYVAVPIFTSVGDTLNGAPQAWQGILYSKTISNRLSPEEKETQYQKFARESEQEFRNRNTSDFIYLDRIGPSETKEGFVEAIKTYPYKTNETVLVGINEPFEARNGNKLAWLGGSAVLGSLVFLLMLLIPKIDGQQLERIRAGRPDRRAQKEWKAFFGLFLPREGYFITPILVNANLLIFAAMVLGGAGFVSFNAQDLLQWGANYGPMTTSGDWWRLLTSTFLHGGLMHVAANMFGLLFVGVFLEPLLGRARYLAFYLLTGITASVASIWWYDATVSVGASGAIFGLYGIFLALLLTKVFTPAFARSFLLSTSIFVGFNLLMGIAGGIDNAAHLGGLISGFVMGCFFRATMAFDKAAVDQQV